MSYHNVYKNKTLNPYILKAIYYRSSFKCIFHCRQWLIYLSERSFVVLPVLKQIYKWRYQGNAIITKHGLPLHQKKETWSTCNEKPKITYETTNVRRNWEDLRHRNSLGTVCRKTTWDLDQLDSHETSSLRIQCTKKEKLQQRTRLGTVRRKTTWERLNSEKNHRNFTLKFVLAEQISKQVVNKLSIWRADYSFMLSFMLSVL